MTIALRRADATEAGRLADIAERCFLNSFGGLYGRKDWGMLREEKFAPASQRAILENPAHEVWFAEEGETCIGYTHISRNGLPCGTPEDAELCRLYLIPETQGRGLGKRLMDLSLARFREWGAKQAYLGVWEHNHRAQAFYRGYGFQLTRDYFYTVGNHLDHELILGRSL